MMIIMTIRCKPNQTKPRHTIYSVYDYCLCIHIPYYYFFRLPKKMNVNIEFECMHEIYNVPNTESSS